MVSDPATSVIAAIVVVLLAIGAAMLMGARGDLYGVNSASDPDRARIERIVHDYLLEHPEIIPEAVRALQTRDLAKAINANRAAIETPFGSAWAGAEKGDVVLVEFFDYACPYCRASNADVARLLSEDKKLKVVWRELPVLGDASVVAAQVSLAAARQGRFRAFHDSMYAAGRPSPQTVRIAQQAAGVAPAPPGEFAAELDKNYQLARMLNATGTPTWVVGDKVLEGAVGYATLKSAIAEARSKG
jgi:protein-disulfide isomerase